MSEREPTVAEIGEFGLIDRIRTICGGDTSPDLLLSIGDDTAVVRLDDHRAMVATCDIQVEDIHFQWNTITPYQLGRRSMAVNLSDIASMGATPLYALTSLAVPPSLPAAHFDKMFAGMNDEVRQFGALVVGGNLARSNERLVVDVFMWGMVDPAHMLTRTGAQAGDVVYVTGALGSSRAGLDVLMRYGPSCSDEYAEVVRAHLEPRPRVREGRTIAQSGLATTMIDVSDGLAADIGHICDSSQVGVEIDESQLPFDAVLFKIARNAERDLREYTLYGGEDYELLFTVRSTDANAMERLAQENGFALRGIGRVVADREGRTLIDPQGTRHALDPKGWDHFRVV
ncbi:MAG: thiamine-phosphate kinase [candidate division Zixibacteria bacterium]|nr:thiamine-phosphate kinase [candidate division Zixibacteria bacterium]